MKKLIAMLLVLILALTLGACGQKAEESAQTPAAEKSSQAAASGEDERPEGEHPVKNTGALSLLNMTEEEYVDFVEARKKLGGKMIEEGYAVPADGRQGAPPEGRMEGDPPEGRMEGDPPEGAPDNLPVKGDGKVIFL